MNWNAFKRLFHYLGRYKLRLILVMIAAVLSTLFTVLTPAVTGGITSELYDGVASGSFDWETIVWLLVTLIALYLVAQLFAILQSFSMTKLTACVMETLRGDIDRKMHHLKLDYYDSHTQGEILSTITNDVDTVNNALRKNPFTGIRTSVSSNCTDRFPRPAFYMAETLAKAIASGWNNYPVKAIPCLLRAGKKMSCHWQRMVSMRFASIAKR